MTQYSWGVKNTADVPNKIEPPEGWDGGRSAHTGGGIFNRTYHRKIDGIIVEVVYNSENHDGVHVQLWDSIGERKEFLDVLDGVALFEYTDDPDRGPITEDCTFENAERYARYFMRAVDEGVYDDEIAAAAAKR